ncbi:imelysin family protein [Arvimicrobium flavum]|uniref:imelysin family protein n=1 Tax=Arvimicrobium flavum TaxID=3393320 RepID=UPI00237A4DE9|nr:imelysin family protein [Mesorhizobium shangrilense]
MARGNSPSPLWGGVRGGGVRRARLAAVFLATCLFLAPTLSAHAENALIARTIEGFVRPAYAAFHETTGRLDAAAEKLCAEPSENSLAAARDSYRASVTAWSRIEAVRFGPVTEQNRLERILFWPDRKSIGLKQVQAAIAEQDPSATDVTALGGKSVAMQGLGALEFVLFGTGADDLASAAGAYRCSYGLAIAGNLDSIAAEVDAAWTAPDGIARQWTNPGPENPLYRSDAEAMTELFNVFVHGLEMVRDVRINGFLGKTPDSDKPKQAVYWRSAATVPSLRADLQGLSDLFKVADFSGQLGPDEGWIAQSIAFEFANADAALKAAEAPPAEILEDGARRAKLDYARLVTSSLSELFGVRLAAALGLSAGFSSLDGD